MKKNVIIIILLLTFFITACSSSQPKNSVYFDLGMNIKDVVKTLGNYDGELPIDDENKTYTYYQKEYNGIQFRFIHFTANKEGIVNWIDYSYYTEDTEKDQKLQIESFKNDLIKYLSSRHEGFKDSESNGKIAGLAMYYWDNDKISMHYSFHDNDRRLIELFYIE